MNFKVKGHSKYKLSLTDGWVKKESFENDNRLVKSALKQKKFKSNYFKTPDVKEINKNSFLMKYIIGKSFSEFFNQATKYDLDLLIEKLDGYFSETIIGDIKIPISILFILFTTSIFGQNITEKYHESFLRQAVT